jgi:hypothetical protein
MSRMPKVKGSKQQRMIVVPYRPWHLFWMRTCTLALLLLVAGLSWYFGYGMGVDENGDAMIERDDLRVEVRQLQEATLSLRQQIMGLEQASLLDKEALAGVQQAILSLREKNSQLEEDVLFYKHILSPENEETGLAIGQLDLYANDKPGSVRFKLELRQLGSNDNLINGHANVNIMGQQEGLEVSIPLRSLSQTVDSLDIPLQFRYFQNIEGLLEMPENFEPEKVQIIAVAEGPGGKTVQKSFGWLVHD